MNNTPIQQQQSAAQQPLLNANYSNYNFASTTFNNNLAATNAGNVYLNALNSGSGGSSASNQLAYTISNNQDSNLSTTSGGSHNSDKDNSIIILSQNNNLNHTNDMTPEKQRDSSAPAGTAKRRKRKHHHQSSQDQDQLNNSILNRPESGNSGGALNVGNAQQAAGGKSGVIQNQGNKKIMEYFKHSPSRFTSTGSKSPTANSSSQTHNANQPQSSGGQQPNYHYSLAYNLPSPSQQHKNASSAAVAAANQINSPPNTPMLTGDFPNLMGPPLAHQLSSLNNTNSLTPAASSQAHSTNSNNSSVIQQQQPQPNSNQAVASSQAPSGGSYMYSNLVSRAVQTDLTAKQIQELETKSANDLEEKETKIDDLQRSADDLKRQVNVHQKTIDKQKEQLLKSTDVTKKLLIDKSMMEKKACRQKCMQNRLRLGQFVTQRQGASFVENWNDGHAFTELIKKQEQITLEREEIERQRKLLAKRKPASVQVKKNNNSSSNVNNSSNSQTNNSSSTNSSNNQNSTGGGLANGTSGVGSTASSSVSGFTDFAKPEAPSSSGAGGSSSTASLNSSTKELTWYEYYEMDEILKLRQQNLKKEDADLQLELEKLERERNLHIRELKRIHNEDQSRFNNHTVLNERYLLLTLLGKRSPFRFSATVRTLTKAH